MIVLMDVGNTRVKLGWWDARLGREREAHALTLRENEQPASSASSTASGSSIASNLSARLVEWLSSLPVPASGACGVSVAASDSNAVLEQTLAKAHIPIRWVRAQAETLGMTNRYDQPSLLGADRWAALLGVAGTYPQNAMPIILATFGTATTIDTLGPNAVFEGGMILPGPALMRSSLALGTAKLPHTQGGSVAFPRNTQQAISTGVLSAQAGALWRQCMVVKEMFPQTPLVCVSGGAWPQVEQEVRRVLTPLKIAIQHLSHPALDGLARLAAMGDVSSGMSRDCGACTNTVSGTSG